MIVVAVPIMIVLLGQTQADRPGFDRALLEAAARGDTQAISTAIRGDGSLDARDEEGRSPLILAAAGGHVDAVKELVASGANLNAQADNGWSALAFAEAEGHAKVVDLLLREGAKWLIGPPGSRDEPVSEGVNESAAEEWSTPPVMVSKPPDPKYPAHAQEEMISGDVILQVKVLTNGATEVVRVIQPVLHCTDVAKENARKWRWKPALKDGEPVEATGIITVTFDISASREDRFP